MEAQGQVVQVIHPNVGEFLPGQTLEGDFKLPGQALVEGGEEDARLWVALGQGAGAVNRHHGLTRARPARHPGRPPKAGPHHLLLQGMQEEVPGLPGALQGLAHLLEASEQDELPLSHGMGQELLRVLNLDFGRRNHRFAIQKI